MTSYKTLLACVDDARTASAVLDLAFRVGASHGAHVAALHVRTDPAAAIPLVGEGMSGAMVEEMMAMAERQATEQAKVLRDLFEATCRDRGIPIQASPSGTPGVSASWRELVGREEEQVPQAGRLSDLMVIARPAAEREPPAIMSLNAALLESGRPLLLAPPKLPATVGRHVAVFWNGSAEASRAVAFAMPFLTAAQQVSIFSAHEEKSAAPAELADYLAWHGIKAVQQCVTGAASVGQGLLAEAETAGADLAVMGAYTHSRLRQLILGGVTRHVLQSAILPVLLSH